MVSWCCRNDQTSYSWWTECCRGRRRTRRTWRLCSTRTVPEECIHHDPSLNMSQNLQTDTSKNILVLDERIFIWRFCSVSKWPDVYGRELYLIQSDAGEAHFNFIWWKIAFAFCKFTNSTQWSKYTKHRLTKTSQFSIHFDDVLLTNYNHAECNKYRIKGWTVISTCICYLHMLAILSVTGLYPKGHLSSSVSHPLGGDHMCTRQYICH